jgi:polygalacturonase
MNYSPFIYAFEQKNIAITGNGTLDGQAVQLVAWTGGPRFGGNKGARMHARPDFAGGNVEKGVPVSEEYWRGHYLRPQFIQPYRCQNVLIRSKSEFANVGDSSRALPECHGARRDH